MAKNRRSCSAGPSMDEEETNVRLQILEERMKEFSSLLDAVKDLSARIQDFKQDRSSHNRGSGHGRPPPWPDEVKYHFPRKFCKMEFPKFQRTDVEGWIRKCDQYFELDRTPEDRKITMTSLQLDEKGYLWHLALMEDKRGHAITWDEYKQAIQSRFGQAFESSMADLKKLQQTGSLDEYHDEFDVLCCKLRLPEEYVVQAYIEGLRDDYARQVRIFRPRTLNEARGLAKIVDLNACEDSRLSIREDVCSTRRGVSSYDVSRPSDRWKGSKSSSYASGSQSFGSNFNIHSKGFKARMGYGSNSSVWSASVPSTTVKKQVEETDRPSSANNGSKPSSNYLNNFSFSNGSSLSDSCRVWQVQSWSKNPQPTSNMVSFSAVSAKSRTESSKTEYSKSILKGSHMMTADEIEMLEYEEPENEEAAVEDFVQPDSGQEASANATEKSDDEVRTLLSGSSSVNSLGAFLGVSNQEPSASYSTERSKNGKKNAKEVGSASDFRTPYMWESIGTTFGEVSNTINTVSSSVSSHVQLGSSLSSSKIPVLTSDNSEMPFGYYGHYEIKFFEAISRIASDFCKSRGGKYPKISFKIKGSSVFDCTEGLQDISCCEDRSEAVKMTSQGSGSQLVMGRGIFLLIFPVYNTVSAITVANTTHNSGIATKTIPFCIESQLYSNSFKNPEHFGNTITNESMGLIFQEIGPKLLLPWLIPIGPARSLLYWVFVVHIFATRSMVLSWFKGKLMKMLQGSCLVQGSMFIDPMLFGLQLPLFQHPTVILVLLAADFGINTLVSHIELGLVPMV